MKGQSSKRWMNWITGSTWCKTLILRDVSMEYEYLLERDPG